MRVGTLITAATIAFTLCTAPASAQTGSGAPVAQAPPAQETPEGGQQDHAVPAAEGPRPIQPANALEQAFVAALTNPEMRPVFRRLLLESQVAVAVMPPGGERAAVRTVPIQDDRRAAAIYTSPARLRAILGADAPFQAMNGRAALTRLRAGNVVLNFMWAPMLTLEPEDIAHYLEAPETPEHAPATNAPAPAPQAQHPAPAPH